MVDLGRAKETVGSSSLSVVGRIAYVYAYLFIMVLGIFEAYEGLLGPFKDS